jgi:hypothetical protein
LYGKIPILFSNSWKEPMASKVQNWLNKRLPQNLILKKPLIGTLILSVIWFGFITLYRPLGVRAARLGFVSTMAAYCLIQGIFIYGSARLLKSIRYFSKESEWTILKEVLAIVFMLFIVGVVIYFAGFIIEPPAHRWNISTFLDSCEKAALIGIIPFAFFTLMNYRYLFFTETEQHYNQLNYQQAKIQNEEIVHISSQLKKEDLNFYPGQFLYCEADGNYVVFHLLINGQYLKKMIRNSINNIEQQLARISFVMRIHRAFIVNLKMVASKKGNTLGYQLKINNIDAEIPVSRNNTKDFDRRMKQLR